MTISYSADGDAWPPERTEDLLSAAAPRVIFPPVVYVPCSPLGSNDTELTVDLRRTRSGQLALLVYSALDRLVDCCGMEQPWTVMPTAELEKIRIETGFDIVLLDMEIPQEHRHRAQVC